MVTRRRPRSAGRGLLVGDNATITGFKEHRDDVAETQRPQLPEVLLEAGLLVVLGGLELAVCLDDLL